MLSGEVLAGKGVAPLPIALFCATFLEPEMLHIHRHVAGLKAFRPVVLAQKRKGDWSAARLEVVERSAWRFLARGREKLTGRPWQISRGEVQRILAIMAAERCALLHVFFGNSAIHLLPLIENCPVPVVVSFHGSDVAGAVVSPGYRSALARLFASASLVAARSEELARRVERLGCPPEKLRLMRTAVPEIGFTERPAPADGAWRIVQAARLVPKKGLATALRAFARFSKKFPEATFTIAGEGPQRGELQALAAALGISGRVQFRGFLSQPDLQRLFAGSHIFLHPSETAGGDVEGVPNAMLEAMASGLPVVATRHGGIPEVINDGVNGLLCAERDENGLAQALDRLAADADFYAKISAQATATIREQFSFDRQIGRIEEIYREALAR